MTSPVSIDTSEHYTWGDGCDGWHLVRRSDLSVIQERVPPGKSEAIHYHTAARQFFFILEGEGLIRLPEGEVTLHQGEGLEVEPGLAHQFCNRSAEDVRFLVISVPPAHGDRVNT